MTKKLSITKNFPLNALWKDLHNIFAILGRCRAAMRDAGYTQVFIDAFVTEATAGNYDDLLATVMRYVVVE